MTERLAVTTESLKRTLPKQEYSLPPKKLKGIFEVLNLNKLIIYTNIFLGILKNCKTPPVPSVPIDFFQSATTLQTPSPVTNIEQETEEKVEEQLEIVHENVDKGELPKGFFDDPMLDAKVSFCVN